MSTGKLGRNQKRLWLAQYEEIAAQIGMARSSLDRIWQYASLDMADMVRRQADLADAQLRGALSTLQETLVYPYARGVEAVRCPKCHREIPNYHIGVVICPKCGCQDWPAGE